jgi:hypothetical protein
MKPFVATAGWRLLALFMIVLSSCTHYIDQVKSQKSWPISDGKMEIFPDSNVLIYKSKVALKADKEVWYPKSFYTLFPKKLKWYEFLGDDNFSFYYDKDQVILISIDLQKSTDQPDSYYVPDNNEIDSLISKHPLPKAKYDVSRIGMIPGRKQYVIRRKSACILLYNIEEKNYDAFVNSVKAFTFL